MQRFMMRLVLGFLLVGVAACRSGDGDTVPPVDFPTATPTIAVEGGVGTGGDDAADTGSDADAEPADSAVAADEDDAADADPVTEAAPEAAVEDASERAASPLPARTAPTRVEFAAGATAATLNGSLEGRATAEYLVYAFGGQAMEVTITSADSRILLTIVGADGMPLKRSVDGEASWQGTLPATQDYVVKAVSYSADPTDYTIDIAISPLLDAGDPAEPERIAFDAGATSASVSSVLSAGGVDSYLLGAAAGQIMRVALTDGAAGASLRVLAADGKQLALRPDVWTGQLPTTGDYIVEVVDGGGGTAYAVAVEIVTPVVSAEPVRVEFPAGFFGTAVTGRIEPAAGTYGEVAYVVSAAAGQTLRLRLLSATPAEVVVSVYDATGAWVTGFDAPPGQLLTTTLPIDGDYTIRVAVGGSDIAVEYTLEIDIR